MGKNSMKPAAFFCLLILSLASCAKQTADIWNAVRTGNAAELRRFISEGVSPNAIEPATGMSPLAVAIAQGNAKMVQVLIKAGADIYEESYSDFIHIEIDNIERFSEAAQQLLDAGARIDRIKDNFCMYMTLNRTRKNAELFDALIPVGKELREIYHKDKNSHNIYISPKNAHLINNVLAYEQDEDKVSFDHITLYRLHSPLKQAVHRKDIKIVRLLLKAAENQADLVNAVKATSYYPGPDYLNLSSLTFAILNGDKKMVKLLLDAGAWTGKEAAKSAWTFIFPLEYAVSRKDAAMTAFLLDYGIDPNLPGTNPLLQAVKAESPEITRMLLRAGARADQEAHGSLHPDEIPLNEAVRRNNTEITRMLLEAGAIVGQLFSYGGYYFVPMVWAVKENNIDIVQLLIEAGENVNLSASVSGNMNFYSSHTPLTQAAENGNMEIFHLLIDAGADVNIIGGDYYSPLQVAAKKDHPEMALELLSMGADVNPEKKEPPLLWAALRGRVDLMRALLDAGADIFGTYEERGHSALTYAAMGVKDRDTFAAIFKLVSERGLNDINYSAGRGRKAIHLSASQGSFEVMKLLIEMGADIHAADDEGKTPLHSLFTWNYIEHDDDNRLRKTQLLIDAGADVNAQDKRGGTPLHLALHELIGGDDESKLAQMLINAGADVNIPSREENFSTYHDRYLCGRYNQLMLHFHRPDIIAMLLKNGADVNARDSYGRSALMIHAYFDQLPEIIKMLTDAGADVNLKNIHGETALDYALYTDMHGYSEEYSYLGERKNKEKADIIINAGAKKGSAQTGALQGVEGIEIYYFK